MDYLRQASFLVHFVGLLTVAYSNFTLSAYLKLQGAVRNSSGNGIS